MLLTNRRTALLHLCLAAMQAAWLTPFWLLLSGGAPWRMSPWGAFGLLLSGLLGWMLTLELLSRRYQSPQYDLAGLGLLALTCVLLVRLALYPGYLPWNLSWLGRAAVDLFNFQGGLPPGLLLITANLVLWQRATVATSRDLAFWGVGVTFRVGMLLLFLGGGLYSVIRGGQLLPLLFVYFAAGLLAVALARIGDKAIEAQSAGAILPGRRLAQLAGAVAFTTGVVALASLAYTPGGLAAFFRLFTPLWGLVRPLLFWLLLLAGRVLDPLLVGLEGWLSRLLRNWAGVNPPESAAGGGAGGGAPPPQLPAWPIHLLRDAFVVILIVGVVVGGLVFLLLYLERVRKAGSVLEGEAEGADPASYGGGLLGRGLASLRAAGRLVRRLGVGRQLLAAISVQNIYANLGRIARRHGHARPPAQPPDAYLPALALVFPGQEPALARITAAYMRVHYGDQPVAMHELTALRADYRAVREAEHTDG